MILGIDPGTSKLGYAIIADEDKIVSSGVIKSGKKEKWRRIQEIAIKLKKEVPWENIHAVAIEKAFVHFARGRRISPDTAIAIGESRGMVITISNDIPVFEYEPTLIKKAITGNGQAKKDLVRRFVEAQSGLSDLKEDEADAIAIAIVHHRRGVNS